MTTTLYHDALKDGQIAGAAVDVTEPEPINTDHPLLSLDNVIIAPHLGSATVQTRIENGNNGDGKLTRWFEGRTVTLWGPSAKLLIGVSSQ